MDLFVKAFHKETTFFIDHNIKVLFSGRRDNLSDEVLRIMDKVVDDINRHPRTPCNCNKLLNYHAMRKAV